jgi:hypothetical protein
MSGETLNLGSREEGLTTIRNFYDPEIKDLCKSSFTFVTATLVFSVTFAEKVIVLDRTRLWVKAILMLSWLAMLVSYGCCGLGLRLSFRAAILANDQHSHLFHEDPFRLINRAVLFLRWGAHLFAVGLVLLALVGVLRLFATPL